MNERGSALVLALFVLVLLAGMGVALLFLTQNELRLGNADLRSKRTYFLAEAGVEAGRAALHGTVGKGSFDGELAVRANDGAFNFDPTTIQPVYDADGNVTSFTGYGDDLPLIGRTALGDGWYAAFLTNDPAEVGTPTTDGNDRVMITAVGAGPDRSFEVVQAIVEKRSTFPSIIPAAITLVGPSPSFGDADSSSKEFIGDDCEGAGEPGLSAPIVGAVGAGAESDIELGINGNPLYTSGGLEDEAAFSDLTDLTDQAVINSGFGKIDPRWYDCENLLDMLDELRSAADVICQEGVACTLPAESPDRVVFAEGDYEVEANGSGLLVVTGVLTFNGNRSWNGPILVVGEGVFHQDGSGNGTLSGGIFLANVSGPDGDFGTADDCTGGTDGLGSAVYDETGGGTGKVVFCSTEISAGAPVTHYPVVEFLQR